MEIDRIKYLSIIQDIIHILEGELNYLKNNPNDEIIYNFILDEITDVPEEYNYTKKEFTFVLNKILENN